MIQLAKKGVAHRKNECKWYNNIKTPGRCEAAYIYNDKLNRFIEKELKSSKQDTSNNQEILLKSRMKTRKSRDIYPIVNHDFDYRTGLLKKYNLYELGFTNAPTLPNLFKAPIKLKKFMDVLVKHPYPNKDTTAGIDDVIELDKRKLHIKNTYRKMDADPPYPSFHKDYPECHFKTTGEHSSSYFIKTGVCKTKIPDKTKCQKMGFKWYDKGACYKPRYTYINNVSRGIFGNKGLQPSMFNDLMSITPDKLFQILAGNSVEGGGILPCIEDFTNNTPYPVPVKSNYPVKRLILITILLIIFAIMYRYLSQ